MHEKEFLKMMNSGKKAQMTKDNSEKKNDSSIEKNSFVILDGFEVYFEDLPNTMTIAWQGPFFA